LLLVAVFLALAPAALAGSTWYADGVNGNDNNDCLSSQTACQTIGHAISLCSSGDTIKVAPAIYYENLTISINLKIIGSEAASTIVDGNQAGTAVTVPSPGAQVTLSKLTIRNGHTATWGGGINNHGALTVNRSIINANVAYYGGGIFNGGTLTIDHCTISSNYGIYYGGGIENSGGTLIINRSTVSGNRSYDGGGIFSDNYNPMTISQSTITDNYASWGGGVETRGPSTINNSTITGNTGNPGGGGIMNSALTLTINNSSIAANAAFYGANIYQLNDGAVILQNSILVTNGGDCFIDGAGSISSKGYNLSNDDSCNFTGPGDMNNTDPKLGKLGNHGGPTQTMRLLPGSPAINAGNPNGCTDGNGNLLTTDQRGWLRPDKQSGRCDIGAFERQKN
jgi:hypothetical protein